MTIKAVVLYHHHHIYRFCHHLFSYQIWKNEKAFPIATKHIATVHQIVSFITLVFEEM